MNNLLQPDVQDVSNRMCANCDALVCAGCPVFEMDKTAADLARITAENIAYRKVCDGKTPEEMDEWIVLMLDAQDRIKEKLSELTRAMSALKSS